MGNISAGVKSTFASMSAAVPQGAGNANMHGRSEFSAWTGPVAAR